MLRAAGLTLRYSDAAASVLQGFDLDLAPGEMALFLGPSRVGKPSLLRILAWLQPPDAGRIKMDGAPQA